MRRRKALNIQYCDSPGSQFINHAWGCIRIMSTQMSKTQLKEKPGRSSFSGLYSSKGCYINHCQIWRFFSRQWQCQRTGNLVYYHKHSFLLACAENKHSLQLPFLFPPCFFLQVSHGLPGLYSWNHCYKNHYQIRHFFSYQWQRQRIGNLVSNLILTTCSLSMHKKDTCCRKSHRKLNLWIT